MKKTGFCRNARGFTLVELLIVVGIIAILAAIAIPQFRRYQASAWRAELTSDAGNALKSATGNIAENPYDTVDSMQKLQSGGYIRSKNVSYVQSNLTGSSGNIVLLSTTLNKAGETSNTIVIMYDGTRTFK